MMRVMVAVTAPVAAFPLVANNLVGLERLAHHPSVVPHYKSLELSKNNGYTNFKMGFMTNA